MPKEDKVKNILFITLSNIGDVVLTLPSLDYLKNRFKDAKFTVVSGPGASVLFDNDPRVKENIAYNKRCLLREKIKLFQRLSKERFEVVVDLRDTTFRWLYRSRYRNPRILRIPKQIEHVRLKHLFKTIRAVDNSSSPKDIATPRLSLFIDNETEKNLELQLSKYKASLNDEYIVVAPGSRSKLKQWSRSGFIHVIRQLEREYLIILIGDDSDIEIAEDINKECRGRLVNLVSKTNLKQVIAILEKAKLVLCNDSAISHFASYLKRPVAVVFGPTNEKKYGPWSRYSVAVRKNTICSPCEEAKCLRNWRCMKKVTPEFVLESVQALLYKRRPQHSHSYRRILISRTDRLGDVLLSTPVIKNLRANMPSAYIAMMVNSSVKEAVEGNPYLDEVIPFDKKGEHKGVINSIRFSNQLKKKNFDLALILHPANRVHLILFFARIKRRYGYDRKLGFLNTHILKHAKQFGRKHEIEYTLDFLRELGFSDFDTSLYMPTYQEAERWADDLLKKLQPKSGQPIIAIHPQASCPSKMWPTEYFTKLIDSIIDIYNPKIIQVGKEIDSKKIHKDVENLSGVTNISQLASIIKRSSLFISNDSGPVHLAVALGVPVISIFSRKQPGLSPRRWGPSSESSIILHKDVGCQVCLAHDCKQGFACLRAVKPEEILEHVDKILSK